MTAPSPQRQVPTTLPSSATAATATTWNPTQQHTIAEYFVKYNMETIPESLNGELPPLRSGSSHGSRGHTYNHNGHNQNLHVPKRSNTYTSSTSTSQYNHQRYAGAESQTQERPSSSLSRSFSSPLSPPSPSGSGSRMIGGGKSTQRVKDWVKRSNSSRESKSKTSGRSSSNSGHQTLEIIHLGGGRVEHESNGHVHSSSLSSNFLAPTSQQTRASVANSIDSRVTQWSDLYHDPPESLTVITKPATATGKPPRPVSPELHERPQLRELGLGSRYNGGGDPHEREGQGQGHQSRHRHTKSDGSIHPAPLRVPSNSSSSTSSSADKKEGGGGAAVAVGVAVTKPEETWRPQGLTRSNSKWKPLPVPPPPGAPGSVTPLVDGGRRAEDNINMAGAIGVSSPLTSVESSESEFGEREDTPRERQQGAHIVNVMVQRSGSRSRKPSPPTTSDDVSLGIGYAVGLGVLSPPLTPPEHEREAAEPGSAGTYYGIRESIWPVPPSYSLSLSQSVAPSRSATAPPEKQRQHQHQHQHQHQQKPSTSSSLASSASPALASSQSVPTHVIPKRSDSLSYSRSRRPQHAPQLSTSSTSASSRSTEKTGHSSAFTEQIATITTITTATATKTGTTTAATQTQTLPHLQTPTVTPPTPIVQVQVPTTSTPTPKTPTWSPRAYLSSKEMLWLHRNYRGITAFMSAWGLSKGLSDEAERQEGLGIMRELMAAEVDGVKDSAARIGSGQRQEADDEEDHERDGDIGKKGGYDNSWLDFSPGAGEKNLRGDMTTRGDVDGGEKEKEGRHGSPNGANAPGYAALKGQGVRMKPRGQGDKEGRHGRRVVGHAEEEEEGSDFF